MSAALPVRTQVILTFRLVPAFAVEKVPATPKITSSPLIISVVSSASVPRPAAAVFVPS